MSKRRKSPKVPTKKVFWAFVKMDALFTPKSVHNSLHYDFGETPCLGKILNFFLIFSAFLKSGWIKFSKTCPLYLLYFRSYWLQNMWLDKCLKSPISEDSSTSNMVNRPKHFKSPRQNLYHIYWSARRKFSLKKSLLYHISSSVWKKLRWKKSLLVIFKILGLFVKSLTADDK